MNIGTDTSSPVVHLPVSTINTVATHTYSFKHIPYFHAHTPHTYNLYTPVLRTKSHFQYKKFVQPSIGIGIGIGTAVADSIEYLVSGIGHLHGIGLTLIQTLQLVQLINIVTTLTFHCNNCDANRAFVKFHESMAVAARGGLLDAKFTFNGWLRSTVGGTPVFGRRTDTVLRSTFRARVTTVWVNRPLKISQLGQLSLSSFRGR